MVERIKLLMLCNLYVPIVGQVVVCISAKRVARYEGCFLTLSTVPWEVTDSPSLECSFRKGLTVTCYSFVWMFVNLSLLGDASAGP